MTLAEARKIIKERRDMAERIIGSSVPRQEHALLALGARDMADWLLSIMDGETPWSA